MMTPVLAQRRRLAWLNARWGSDLLAYAASLLSPLLFLGWPLLKGNVLLSSDLLDFFWPYHDLWASYVRTGTLPLWNPYLFSGMPFLADPQSMALCPLNVLFLFLPSLVAIQVFLLLGYGLLTAFTYYYVRTMGRSRLAGLCAAFSLSYGLYLVIHWPHPTILYAVLWLPLQLGFVERLAATHRPRYAILLAGALALQVFGGHPQFLLYSFLVLGAYLVAHVLFARADRLRLVKYLSFAVLAGAMLSAIQLIPALELAMHSSRQALSYAQFSVYSLRPVLLVQLAAPFLFGAPSSIIYRVAPFVSGWEWESVFYPGALATVCLVSLVTVRRRLGWREGFWGLILVWGLVFALGKYTPAYRLAYRLPVYNWFRSAGRHLFLVSLALAAIAGLRIDDLMRAGRKAIVATLVAFLTLAGALVVFSIVQEHPALAAAYGAHPVRLALLLPLVTFGALFLLLWADGDRWPRRGRAKGALLLGLVVCDLFLTSATTVPSVPRSQATGWQGEFKDLVSTLPGDGSRVWYLTPRHAGNNNLFAPVPAATSYNPLIVQHVGELMGIAEPTGASFMLEGSLATRETVLNLLDVGYLLVPKTAVGQPLLDTTCQQRIMDRCFAGSNLRIELSPGEQLQLPLPPGQAWSGVALVSALAYADGIPQETPVASVSFLEEDDRVLSTLPLRAGVDTAEWAADCLLPGQRVQHREATVARSWASTRTDGSACQGHDYFAALDMEGDGLPTALVIRNTSAAATLLIDDLSLSSRAGETAGYVLDSGLYSAALPESGPAWRTDRFAGYRRQPAWGHAWPVRSVEVTTSESFLQALYTTPQDLDLAQVAYVGEADLPTYQQSRPGLLETQFDDEATVRVTDLQPNALSLEVKSNDPAFVVLSEMYYPGWVARVDGEKADLLRVDQALRGIVVPAGTTSVEVAYRPYSVYLGALVSVLGLGLTGAFAWSLFRRHESR